MLWIFFSEKLFLLRVPPQAELSAVQCERRAHSSVIFRGIWAAAGFERESIKKGCNRNPKAHKTASTVFVVFFFHLSLLYNSGYRISFVTFLGLNSFLTALILSSVAKICCPTSRSIFCSCAVFSPSLLFMSTKGYVFNSHSTNYVSWSVFLKPTTLLKGSPASGQTHVDASVFGVFEILALFRLLWAISWYLGEEPPPQTHLYCPCTFGMCLVALGLLDIKCSLAENDEKNSTLGLPWKSDVGMWSRTILRKFFIKFQPNANYPLYWFDAVGALFPCCVFLLLVLWEVEFITLQADGAFGRSKIQM